MHITTSQRRISILLATATIVGLSAGCGLTGFTGESANFSSSNAGGQPNPQVVGKLGKDSPIDGKDSPIVGKDPDSGSCSIVANRNGNTDQCTVNVSGLGLKPPKLFKNGTEVTGVNWLGSGDDENFIATTTCELDQSTTFKAQSASGSDSCDAAPIPIATRLKCDSFSVKWSVTRHGFCDYSVTGKGSAVLISDGTNTYEQDSLTGSIPCSPWSGSYDGGLSFTATLKDASGNSFECPVRQLKCNAQTVQLASGPPSQTIPVSIDDNGLRYNNKVYRHWLFLYSQVMVRSPYESSVSIGPNTVTRPGAPGTVGFGGIGLAVGSSGNYTGGKSRYFQFNFYEYSGSHQPSSGKGPETSAIVGNTSVKWIGSNLGDGNGNTLGAYVGTCTNNTRESLAPWFRNGYSDSLKQPRVFFDFLKP